MISTHGLRLFELSSIASVEPLPFCYLLGSLRTLADPMDRLRLLLFAYSPEEAH